MTSSSGQYIQLVHIQNLHLALFDRNQTFVLRLADQMADGFDRQPEIITDNLPGALANGNGWMTIPGGQSEMTN